MSVQTRVAALLLAAAIGGPYAWADVPVNSTQFFGYVYEVPYSFNVTSVGARMSGNGNGTLFLAIVRLSGNTALPTGNPFDGTTVASTTFTPPSSSGLVSVPLSVTLPPGDYAILFGSGQFGATGTGNISDNQSDVASYYVWGIGWNGSTWSQVSPQTVETVIRGTPTNIECLSGAVYPVVRNQDYTAPAGDLTITCAGGTLTASGVAVPQVTVTLSMNTAITSKITDPVSSPNFNEALLVMDEAGVGSTSAPILNCGNSAAGAPYDATAGAGVCTIISDGVGTDTYNGTPGHPNVFQGRQVPGSNNQQIQFTVPLDGGANHTIRVTNLRANAVLLLGSSNPSGINSQLRTGVTLSGPQISASTLVVNGALRDPTLSLAGSSLASYGQCSASGTKSGGSITVSEGFPGAWRARNWRQIQDNGTFGGTPDWLYNSTTKWTAADVIQNVVNTFYSTETGFFFPPNTDAPPLNPPPGLSNSTSTPPGNNPFIGGGTGFENAGGVSNGTRMAFVFSNVPAGSNATVPSVIPLTDSFSLTQNGVMIAFAGTDSHGAGGTPMTSGAAIPLADTGTTMVVYEVLFSDPLSLESLTIPVTINPAGTPPTGQTAQVQMVYAPFYGPTETPNPGAPQLLGSPPTGLPIPRFLNSLSNSISLFNFTPCTQLSGLITAKTGTANARIWTATLTNIGASPAAASQITGLTLLQTFGPACTPVIATPFPLAVGDLAPSASGSANMTIDFSACNPLARFITTLSYSSDGGAVTGSKTLFNQFR